MNLYISLQPKIEGFFICSNEQRTWDTTTDSTEQRMARTSLTQHIPLPSAGSAKHLCIGWWICHALKVIFPLTRLLPFKSNGREANMLVPFYQGLFLLVSSGSVSSINSSQAVPKQDKILPHPTISLWINCKLIVLFTRVQVAVGHQPPLCYELLTKRIFFLVSPPLHLFCCLKSNWNF